MKVRVNVSIEDDVLETMDEAARLRGQTRSDFIEYLYFDYAKVRNYARELMRRCEDEEDYGKRHELYGESFLRMLGHLGYLEDVYYEEDSRHR